MKLTFHLMSNKPVSKKLLHNKWHLSCDMCLKVLITWHSFDPPESAGSMVSLVENPDSWLTSFHCHTFLLHCTVLTKKSSMKYKFVKLNDFDLEKLLLLYDIGCSISKRWCRKDNSGALAVELQFYCTSPSICTDDGRLGIFCWYNVSLQRVSARSRCFYDLSLLLANMIFSMTSPLVSSSCKHLFCHPEVNISQQWAAGLYQ